MHNSSTAGRKGPDAYPWSCQGSPAGNPGGRTWDQLLVQLGWAAHCAWTLKLQASSKKGIMARNGSESIQVLINHWRWLEANGYKQQAASCKRQAASLTRKNYNVIGEARRKKNENK